LRERKHFAEFISHLRNFASFRIVGTSNNQPEQSMSLEQAVASLEETMKTLITVLQSGAALTPAAAAAPVAPAPAPVEPKKTKAEKPVTKFIHIPKNRTVAEIKPGDAMPSIEGTVEITKEEHDRLKAEYSTPPAVTFKAVVDKITELSKLATEGRGRAGVKAILEHFLPGQEGVKVPNLEPLGKHQEILDAAQSLIDTGKLPGAPAASADDEDLGL
jgi:hypothetical protein